MAKEIRFAVGSSADLRSSVWRLWANKNELFLAARTMAGISKISFHQSGICRYAVVSTTPRPALGKWQKPRERDPGIIPLFDIIVPAFSRDGSFRDKLPPKEKHTEFIPAPNVNTKLIVRILTVNSSWDESDLRELGRKKNVSFHGSVQLKHQTAWLTSFSEGLRSDEVNFIANIVDTTRLTMKRGSKIADAFCAFAHVLHTPTLLNPIPNIVDLQLGQANIHIPEE